MPATPTILVLDDDADMRYLHRCELQKEFPVCFIVECGTTDEALARSATICLDIVLTDHELCGNDGAEFIGRLRKMGVRCPVVMVTGSSDPSVHATAYAAGASRVIFGTKQGFAPRVRWLLEPAPYAVVAYCAG